MYKLYFKQAIEMLKQNKFISIITIMGTALAIMMIMVIIVTDSIKKISVAPEVNRDRTMYMRYETKVSKDGDIRNIDFGISYEVCKNYLFNLKTPEYISLQSIDWNNPKIKNEEDKTKDFSIKLKYVDFNFWKIMSFSFIEGNPFSQEDFNSGLKKVVLTEKIAKAVFGNQSAIGKTIFIESTPYTVVGVVTNVSSIFKYAHSDVYAPYTSNDNYEKSSYDLLILAKNNKEFDAISREIREMEKKFNIVNPLWDISLLGPFSHSVQLLNTDNNEPNVKGYNRKMFFIFSVLLLIPAMNLSSFSLSRIQKRKEEIGVRKAFGARKTIILTQVLYENLITSLIGGFIGLLLSYGVVVWLKSWLLEIGNKESLPIETFISLPVFFSVFMVCVLLNLISAGIPAYRASKMKIVDSLNNNQES